MDAWVELNSQDEDAAWERIDTAFRFRPSVHATDWPVFAEPTPSTTYAIGHIYTPGQMEALDENLTSCFLTAFNRLIDLDEWIYALDWQHSCYRLYPHHLLQPTRSDAWKVPILPNGDYYLFLEQRFRFGLLGSPWEQTMCIFGPDLLATINDNKPTLFTKVVRRDGKTV